MNKNTILILVAVALVVLWYFFFQSKSSRGSSNGIPDAEGWYYFKYHGGSALRVDGQGQAIDCGSFNAGAGEPSPADFFAFMEIGRWENGTFAPDPNANCKDGQCKLIPGDVLGEFEILSGASNTTVPFGDSNLTINQLGTDTCTPSGSVLWPQNGIMVDLVIRPEGAADNLYETTGPVYGRFKLQ